MSNITLVEIERQVHLDKPDCSVRLRAVRVDAQWRASADFRPGPICMGASMPSMSLAMSSMLDKAAQLSAHPSVAKDRQWYIDHMTEAFIPEVMA